MSFYRSVRLAQLTPPRLREFHYDKYTDWTGNEALVVQGVPGVMMRCLAQEGQLTYLKYGYIAKPSQEIGLVVSLKLVEGCDGEQRRSQV